MTEEAGRATALVYLLICAHSDLRTHRISLSLTCSFALAGVLFRLRCGQGAGELIAAVLPGAGLLLCALLSEGGIGTGDGLALCTVGLLAGAGETLSACAAGFAAAGLYGGLLLAGKRSRKTEFPFLPFLLFGELVTVFFSMKPI